MEQSRPSRILRLALGGAAVAGLLLVLRAWLDPKRPEALGTAFVSATGPSIVVEVRNGTSRPGLARQVTRLLRERGADVVYFGQARIAADSTQVLVRRGEVARGHEVARMLGTGAVRSVPDSLLRVDVTVLLGKDYRLPKDRLPL